MKTKIILTLLFVAVSVSAVLYYINYFSGERYAQEEEEPIIDTVITEPVQEPLLAYGIVVDSLDLKEDVILRNQNLSDILVKYNVSYVAIDQVARNSKEIYDVRKLSAHKKYTLLLERDSISTARYFIYEPSPVEYIVYDLREPYEVKRHEREVVIKEKFITGRIHTSLYVDMTNKGASASLVNKLADIYGWQLDFFRVQKGDTYKVIYEEKSVEGIPVGIGEIKGAYFEHVGNPYYAIKYDQGEGDDYFDESGLSLEKAFLRAPVEFSRISSRYSGNRYHPVQKRWKAHLGTDYAAPQGTPIRATGDGVVSEAHFKKYNGNYVKVRHNSTYSTQYLHMSKIASGIKPGTRVRQGQTIGYVGSTGLATGPHVCYRFWKNGRQVDALQIEIPPSNPIKEENMDAFNKVKLPVMQQLNGLHVAEEDQTILASAK